MITASVMKGLNVLSLTRAFIRKTECEVREIMGDRFNLFVKTFKQANPNLTQEEAPKIVKEYYDTIKNKSDVEKLVREMEMSE